MGLDNFWRDNWWLMLSICIILTILFIVAG